MSSRVSHPLLMAVLRFLALESENRQREGDYLSSSRKRRTARDRPGGGARRHGG